MQIHDRRGQHVKVGVAGYLRGAGGCSPSLVVAGMDGDRVIEQITR